jgi:hypothetical protein
LKSLINRAIAHLYRGKCDRFDHLNQSSLDIAFGLFTRVVLREDFLTYHLRRGDVATIVECHLVVGGEGNEQAVVRNAKAVVTNELAVVRNAKAVVTNELAVVRNAKAVVTNELAVITTAFIFVIYSVIYVETEREFAETKSIALEKSLALSKQLYEILTFFLRFLLNQNSGSVSQAGYINP